MTWDKNLPDGDQAVSLGDDAIRANNAHLESTLGKEHNFPGPASASGGEHLEGSGRIFFGDDTPNPVVGLLKGHVWWHETDQRLRLRGSSSWKDVGTYQYGNKAARDAFTPPYAGYIWVRTDDTNIDTWDGSAWRQLHPVRKIEMFAGTVAQIPLGWALCDGSIGVVGPNITITVPDLGGRFIVGSDPGGDADYDTTDPLGTPLSGGSKTATLVQANLPSGANTGAGTAHSHHVAGQLNGIAHGALTARARGTNSLTGVGVLEDLESTDEAAHTHDLGGSDTPFDTRNPYYVLAYIIKV